MPIMQQFPFGRSHHANHAAVSKNKMPSESQSSRNKLHIHMGQNTTLPLLWLKLINSQKIYTTYKEKLEDRKFMTYNTSC
jgi:hypothetical protein